MTGRLLIGLFFIAIGISIFTGISLSQYFIALFFVFIGIRMLTGKKTWVGRDEKVEVNEDYINEVLIFSAMNKSIKSTEFRGGKIVTIFAGGEVDLTSAKPVQKEFTMEYTAIFGGLKVIIPKTWKVNSEGVGILGGFDNKTTGVKTDTVLNIKGAAIFGGIEVVNG